VNPEFEFAVRLAPDPRAPAAARHVLDGLVGALPDEVVHRFQVVASELVTNAIKHAAGNDPIRVLAALESGRIRLQVIDLGPGFQPGPTEPHDDQQSGWGLYLVERMCNRWGVRRNHETVVWAEFDLEAA
jgi:anti-sigma regulatory factor (Ser/Thr protein kinase)